MGAMYSVIDRVYGCALEASVEAGEDACLMSHIARQPSYTCRALPQFAFSLEDVGTSQKLLFYQIL